MTVDVNVVGILSYRKEKYVCYLLTLRVNVVVFFKTKLIKICLLFLIFF